MYLHALGWQVGKKDKIDIDGPRLKEKQGLYTCPPSHTGQKPFHCCLEVKEELIRVRLLDRPVHPNTALQPPCPCFSCRPCTVRVSSRCRKTALRTKTGKRLFRLPGWKASCGSHGLLECVLPPSTDPWPRHLGLRVPLE
jgi:hypothetical protein